MRISGVANSEPSLEKACGSQSRASEGIFRRRQQLKLGDAMTEAEQIAWCQGLGAMILDESK